MRRTILMTLALLTVTAPSLAQEVIPIRYRITRTAPGQPTIQHTFLKAGMSCDLPVLTLEQMGPGTVRVTDPERLSPERDCEVAGSNIAPIFVNLVREVEYSFSMAGQANDVDPYGPDATFRILLPRVPQIPPAPGNPRGVPPGVQTLAVLGTVLQRGPAFGLDVALTSLDGIPNFPFYFGGATLTAGAYAVAAGDRFILQLWKP